MNLRGKLHHIFTNTKRNYVILTQIINAIIALITGKLIAIYISPADFGTYNIQFATYTLFLTLLITPFIHFIKTSNRILLPKIGSKLFFYTIGILSILAFLALIAFLYFYYGIFDPLLFLIFLCFIPFTIANSVLADFLNIQDKIIDFSRLSILKAGSGLVFIALFFFLGLTFIDDVQVLWLMQLTGAFIGIIFFASKYRIYKTKFTIAYKTFLKKYIRFAAPLMFLATWSWINNYFDRYAIEYFLSLDEVGIYNASYGVGSKFFLLLSPIFMVLLTPTVFSPIKSAEKKSAIQSYGLYYLILAIPVLLIIYFLKDFLGYLLLSESYKEGFYLIFWIAVAFFMLTFAQLYELYFYSELKTKVILYGNVLSAVLNIILNIVLIPKYGILGAALATFIGFMAHFGVVYYNFRRI
jgi:O-antigen/teichoic acid export membrane protein